VYSGAGLVVMVAAEGNTKNDLAPFVLFQKEPICSKEEFQKIETKTVSQS
jgi:hypothetical protein